MTVISDLEKEIKEVEKNKEHLFRVLEMNGWRGYKTQKYESDFHIINESDIFQKDKRRIPQKVSALYQNLYAAIHVLIEKNQKERIKEIEKLHDSITYFIKKRFLSEDEQYELMDLINFQFDILAAVPQHIKYSVYDLELTIYSVLMDDDLEAARYLLKNGFLRAAGAVAGVTLERHLKNILRKHTPPIKHKEKATLSQLNDLCKESGVYDVVRWRKIQHLIDLRNLCDHDKEREPTKKEVKELIDGVSSVIKEISL